MRREFLCYERPIGPCGAGSPFAAAATVTATSFRFPDVDSAARHVAAEFLESPGLRLSAAQVQKLWRLGDSATREVLALLVEARVLRIARDGSYVRLE